MLYVQHWSFKTGYHQKGAEKFLGGFAYITFKMTSKR